MNNTNPATSIPAAPSKATADDIEIKSTWRSWGEDGSDPAKYVAEGTVTNTGNATANLVVVDATFKGTKVVDIQTGHYFFDPDVKVAFGTDDFKNLRPGETRQFRIEGMPVSRKMLEHELTQKYRRHTGLWDLKAESCAVGLFVN